MLRTIQQRSRLLGLDKPGAWKAGPQTVEMSPDELAAWEVKVTQAVSDVLGEKSS